MKFSTSTRISLWFSLLTTLIVGLFGRGVMSFFSHNRQRAEQAALKLSPPMRQKNVLSNKENKDLGSRFTHTLVLEANELERDFFHDHQQQGLVQKGDRRFMYTITDEGKVILRDVTTQVHRQHYLARLVLWGTLLAAIVSFLLGKFFVHRALRDLRIFAKKVEKIDIDTLQFEHTLTHLPEDDEIRTIAQSLEDMSNTLHTQVTDIKSFVANAAHELRTPLMIMRSSAELARKTKNYEEQLPHITQTIDQMEGLIATLLLLARTETNGFDTQDLDPTHILLPILEQLKTKRSHKDIQMSFSTSGSRNIEAHAGSLERIFHNLVDNAYKYTPDGGTISVRIDATSCIVSDTGGGIDVQALEHIWKPFWQADVSRGKDSGFGLGLSLVKRLIDLHGWTIAAESEIGKGSKFSIRFI